MTFPCIHQFFELSLFTRGLYNAFSRFGSACDKINTEVFPLTWKLKLYGKRTLHFQNTFHFRFSFVFGLLCSVFYGGKLRLKRKHKAMLVLQVQLWGHGLGVIGATCIVMFCFNDWLYPAVLILLQVFCALLCYVARSCALLSYLARSCALLCYLARFVCFVVLCCAIVCFVARFLSYYTIHCFFSCVEIHENGLNNRSWRFLQLNTRYPKY